jgi:RNA polymerase sigma factor (sigma-70 family)
MVPDRHGPLLRQLRTLFSVGTAGGLSDAELLERFCTREGEAAELSFAVLVERHGSMVLRVCRQVLRDSHAAEDAFQATFLVLARKARSLRARDSLAPWLHEVARRTACRLRAAAVRRTRHERSAADRAEAAVCEGDHEDLGGILHEELGRLPARYRVPLLLCYLEGLTSQQAAQQLGWPAATVRSRLARGRERLRTRLIRRGVVPSVAALAAALSSAPATAAVPATLADVTARAAALLAAGSVAAGAVPASILTLTEGVIAAMAMTKLKVTATVLVVGLATTAWALGQSLGGRGDVRLTGTTVKPVEVPTSPVQTSGGGGQPTATPESARLQEVERKLDRILEALGAARPDERDEVTKPDARTEKSASGERLRRMSLGLSRPLPDDPDTEALPAATPPVTPAYNNFRDRIPRATDKDFLRPEPADSGGRSPSTGATIHAMTTMQRRLDRVEQTLADLVARVNRLERLGPNMPEGS